MNNSTTVLGQRLKELRIAWGLNQTELGKELGVSRGAVSYYENGERTPDIEVLCRISRFFNVASDYLLGLSDNSTTDIAIQDISTRLGLSDKAINNLSLLNSIDSNDTTGFIDTINYLLSNVTYVETIEDRFDFYKRIDALSEEGNPFVYAGSTIYMSNKKRENYIVYGQGAKLIDLIKCIIFDDYIDLNPYMVTGGDSKQLIVQNKLSTNDGYITLIDKKKQTKMLNIKVVKKGLYVELNNILEKIENEYQAKNSTEFPHQFYAEFLKFEDSCVLGEEVKIPNIKDWDYFKTDKEKDSD